MTEAPDGKETQQTVGKAEAVAQMKQHYVEVLMSQTTWSEDEARQKLEENGYNVHTCVRIFMGLPISEVPSKPKTVNQSIYQNIRGMMDDASRRYERKKAMEERIEAAKRAYVAAASGDSETKDDS